MHPLSSAARYTYSPQAEVLQHLHSLCWLQVAPGGRVLDCSPSLGQLLGFETHDLTQMSFPKLFCAQEEAGELPHAQSILTANQNQLRAQAHWRHKNGHLLPVGLYYQCMHGAPGGAYREAFSVPMLVVVFEREAQNEAMSAPSYAPEMLAAVEGALNDWKELRDKMPGAMCPAEMTRLGQSLMKCLELVTRQMPGSS